MDEDEYESRMPKWLARIYCNATRIWDRLGGVKVNHVVMWFGPEEFEKRVGAPTCYDCRINNEKSDLAALCEACLDRWFNAAFSEDFDKIVFCNAHNALS